MPDYFVYALTGPMAGKFDVLDFPNDAARDAEVAAGVIQDPRDGARFLLAPTGAALHPIKIVATAQVADPKGYDFTIARKDTSAVISNAPTSFLFDDGTVMKSATGAVSKSFANFGIETVKCVTADGRGAQLIFNVQSDPAKLSIGSRTLAEGDSGTTAFTFAVTRTVNTGIVSSANWAVTGTGANPAAATDFVGGVFPTGTVSFAIGESTKNITVNVAGDTDVETDETFAVTLSGFSAGTVAGSPIIGTGTITNDDVTPPAEEPAAAPAPKKSAPGKR